MASDNKSVPSSIEAENAVLGSIIIDPDVFAKVEQILTPKSFYRERNGWIYEAMYSLVLRNEPIDFTLICDELERMGRLDDVGGAAYIADIYSGTPTAMYAEHYAGIVDRSHRLRMLISTAGKLAEKAYDDDADPNAIVEEISTLLSTIEKHNEDEKITLGELLGEEMSIMGKFMEAHEKGVTLGLRFGWQIDHILNGLQGGNLTIVAARPGVGKTSLTLAMSMQLAERGIPGIFFSLEMTSSEVLKKMIAHYSMVDSAILRNYTLDDEQVGHVMEAAEIINRLPLLVIDQGCSTIHAIRRRLREITDEIEIKYIVIDYIQLMFTTKLDGGEGDGRQQAMEYIVQSLKAIAKEFDIVVLAVSQLNRGVEYRQDKRPMLADLRSSGAIEQSGDSVIFLYRDEMYGDSVEDAGIAEINVCKNRHGRTGTVKMEFDKEHNIFRDVTMQRIVENGEITPEFEKEVARLKPHTEVQFWHKDD